MHKFSNVKYDLKTRESLPVRDGQLLISFQFMAITFTSVLRRAYYSVIFTVKKHVNMTLLIQC